MVQVSFKNLVIIAQALIILFLSGWLYVEYLNNPFLQAYLATFWEANSIPVLVGMAIFSGVVAGLSMATLRRGRILSPSFGAGSEEKRTPGQKTEQTAEKVHPTEPPSYKCPYCQGTLQSLSPGRYRCRECNRFFKD